MKHSEIHNLKTEKVWHSCQSTMTQRFPLTNKLGKENRAVFQFFVLFSVIGVQEAESKLNPCQMFFSPHQWALLGVGLSHSFSVRYIKV